MNHGCYVSRRIIDTFRQREQQTYLKRSHSIQCRNGTATENEINESKRSNKVLILLLLWNSWTDEKKKLKTIKLNISVCVNLNFFGKRIFNKKHLFRFNAKRRIKIQWHFGQRFGHKLHFKNRIFCCCLSVNSKEWKIEKQWPWIPLHWTSWVMCGCVKVVFSLAITVETTAIGQRGRQ